jgi:site-specific recombinase XerD
MLNRRPLGLLALFVAEKEAANVRASTIGYYRFAVLKFLATPGLPNDAAQLSPDHLREWLRTMRERGLKPGGIRTYQSAVWTWLRWMHLNDYLPTDITRRVPMIRVRKEERTRRTATGEIHDRFVRAALDRAENPRRNAAIIETLWSSGCGEASSPRSTWMTMTTMRARSGYRTRRRASRD